MGWREPQYGVTVVQKFVTGEGQPVWMFGPFGSQGDAEEFVRDSAAKHEWPFSLDHFDAHVRTLVPVDVLEGKKTFEWRL